MTLPWSAFELGWARYQKSSEDYRAPILSGGSYVTQDRWLPSADHWLWIRYPGRQLETLPVHGVTVLWPTKAKDAWSDVTEGYEKIRARSPHALWNPNSGQWENLLFPNPNEPPPVPPSNAPKLTDLEAARQRARYDRARELSYAYAEYAAGRLDTEAYRRELDRIEALYKGLT